MPDHITLFFDYACPYAYRTMRWLEAVQAAKVPLDITYKTLWLREINRGADEASLFEQLDRTPLGLHMLELCKAAQAADLAVFARYHGAVYDTMHGEHQRRMTPASLDEIAELAGLDLRRFREQQAAGTWRQAVARDHVEGVERWRAFGTPTLVFDDDYAQFLKFVAMPATPDAAAALYRRLRELAAHRELAEIKYT